ncbi:thymidylate synthase [Tenacibaculum phage pT24]|uniref:thymidylate synthase n=1 Tax=Tenacibaculum phage pT24 TaxID=1880590 RepID=A0A1B4XWX5_9CAUD|nr:thymidylate synthase [Tenacibaculum phage pT24]BAV39316.1 thymidylate synthase [Tenacibaculum phage pT24]
MKQYLDILRHVRENGDLKADRTGVGTISCFGLQMQPIDLRKGLPVVTTKKIHLPSVIHELLWFFKGTDKIDYLTENKVRIWNEWAVDNSIGNMYGVQWMKWKCSNGEEINQIEDMLELLKTNPDSRRNVVTSWNPETIPDSKKSFKENIENGKGALANCHGFFQVYTAIIPTYERMELFKKEYPLKYGDMVYDKLRTSEFDEYLDKVGFPKRYLDMKHYIRSNDLFLGAPFNITSYCLMMEMICKEVNMIPRFYHHTFGDAHIYTNHLEQVDLQLTREPKKLPTLRLNPNVKRVVDFRFEDFEIIGYDPHPHIKGKVAV